MRLLIFHNSDIAICISINACHTPVRPLRNGYVHSPQPARLTDSIATCTSN